MIVFSPWLSFIFVLKLGHFCRHSPGKQIAPLKQEATMKKVFLILVLSVAFLAPQTLLEARTPADPQYGNRDQYRYKPRNKFPKYTYRRQRARQAIRVRPRMSRRMYRRYVRDMRRIRKYELKIEKLRYRISIRRYSPYRVQRYIRKIRSYRFKIRTIERRWGRYRH